MSSYWSMYIVPDAWTLRDCMCIGYMYESFFMLNKEELKTFMDYKGENWDRLYNEILKQPCIYEYTSDSGDPDHKKIMNIIPVIGRLYRFREEAYELVKELKDFQEQYEGKRYMCLN